jgi:hypothetical protein
MLAGPQISSRTFLRPFQFQSKKTVDGESESKIESRRGPKDVFCYCKGGQNDPWPGEGSPARAAWSQTRFGDGGWWHWQMGNKSHHPHCHHNHNQQSSSSSSSSSPFKEGLKYSTIVLSSSAARSWVSQVRIYYPRSLCIPSQSHRYVYVAVNR